MPVLDEQLTAAFREKELDVVRLRAGSAWHEQSSDNHHHGLPRRRGLWVFRIEPGEPCCCHPVMLFVLVQLGARRRIRKVETMVCQAYADGSHDELVVELFPHDRLEAQVVLWEAIKGAVEQAATGQSVSESGGRS